MNNYLLISILLLLTSCSNRTLEQEVSRFVGQQVALPTKMQSIVERKDSTVAGYLDSKTKLVVWYDSVGCASCEISKLHAWNNILAFADGMKHKFNVVFIFSPKQSDSHLLSMSLKNSMVDVPLFVDKESAFVASNKCLPTDKRLHAFLLDSTNKVVMVGNPLYNEKLWELYKITIREITDK